VDGYAFASGDVADDGFAANGVTTACAVDEEIVLAFDLERVGTFAEEDALDGVRHVGERVANRAWLWLLGLDGHGAAGLELVEGLAGRVLAEADGGEEVAVSGEAVFGGDAVVVGFLEAVERDFELAGFTFEELLSDFDGTGALVFVEPMLDLVAGTGTLGEAKPVA
jgi:hypothetical protein